MTSVGEPLEINSPELVHLLRERTSAGCVVLDCRPFLDFSLAHVSESRNVNWNSVLRRRSKGAEVVLDWLIPDKTLLGRMRRGGELSRSQPVVVVVVDESSRSVGELKAESVAQMLLTALRNEVRTQLCFLKGGFEGFSEAYPELCFSKTLSAVESEPPVSSGRKTPAYDQDGPVELLPFLFLGSAVHSSRRETLTSAGITAVLNVSSCPNFFEGELQYLRLTVEDTLAADIRACFSTAIAFIDAVKLGGGRVLVHCQAGISRSATICLAYLMRTRRVRLDEAFEFVKQRRQVISPNLGFMGQLLQFETDVMCQG
ncbi:dual specificity protein phosphatase 2 [Phyllopteryx taeniolatus]|uniref:dual specificity protein phosphatase 2 n=1 Tax=Phyllopteryx taeniolatus TaxID=161469 RepID=UPI002AD4173E|nr:dual specificity protein phosphatase 2 [Phyllopteryx taeniolatus]